MTRLTRFALRVSIACACAATSACDWPWHHDMADQPSSAASQGPRSPATGTTPVSARDPGGATVGEHAVNPLPADAVVVARGRALYDAYCVPCHGPTGSGRDAAVAPYFPRVGDLAAPDVQAREDGSLFTIITSGTPAMPAYAHELDVRERWAIVRFVRTLAR